MINEENLQKMYDGILNGQELTTKELNGYGFHSTDLTNLIKNGTLERINRGHYSFKSIDDLLGYGKKLILIKQYDKATTCFLKCHELNPNHLETCLQLFLRCIGQKDYKKAFEYFDYIYDTNNKCDNTDGNYFLYLLSMITELPEKYRQYAKSLKLEDIRVDSNDKRDYEIPIQNKIRIASLNQKFIFALEQLNDFINQKDSESVQDIIAKTLLCQAIEEQNRTKKEIIELVNEKQYEEVIEYLETLQSQHNLSLVEEYTLILVKDLLEIIRTGIVPEKQVFSTDKLFEAINGKNYELALSIIKEYDWKNKEDSRYVLLTEIQNLIHSKENSLVKQETRLIVEQQMPQLNPTAVSVPCNNTFADIIGYLMKNDLDNSFLALRNYLDSIGKKQYEFLIIDLIKISLIEEDIAFTKPMIALTYITRENFAFNISEYIQNFYEALAQNHFDKARIYLDIISKSNDLGQPCVLTEGLETVLNNTEKMLNYRRNNAILKKKEQAIQSTQRMSSTTAKPQYIESEATSLHHPPTRQKEESISKEQTVPSNNEDYDDNEFMNQILNVVYEKGIILLKPMDSERRERIHDIVKNIPDIVSFSIGLGDSIQLVLRFKSYVEDVDIKKLLRVGKEAYKNENYDSCIKAYRQLLKYGNPKSYVYAKLGLAYMKKNDINTAIDYLTVATELSKHDNKKFDFTELIAKLNGLISRGYRKPYAQMSINDFGNDMDDYYGIGQIEQIAELVSSGISIDEACLNVGLNEEQKSIVALIFAKECYAIENYTMGNQYLKKVERTKNKSKFVKALLEEVRKNKKFYKNRIDEGQKHLILTSKK